jgi:hypothetical protein
MPFITLDPEMKHRNAPMLVYWVNMLINRPKLNQKHVEDAAQAQFQE